MDRRAALLLALVAVLPCAPAFAAEEPVAAARALLAAWHEDPTRIDRARALLEAAAGGDAGTDTLVELARAWFLAGDFRVRAESERLAAYARGSEVAQRAVAADPRSERAHLWLALNTGRAAELRGALRALTLLHTVREESATVLRLDPASVEGLILAGSLAAQLPGFLGGNRTEAERLFRRALEVDSHRTGARLELARLYITTKRWREARDELQRVLDEPAPTDLPRWTVFEVQRARELLEALQ